MENSPEKDFNEFKLEILNMINHALSQNSLVSQLNNYLKDIISTNFLKPPLKKETRSFLEDFSVQVINKILQTKEKSKSIQKSYQSILINYVKILTNLITSPYTKFINASQSIVTQKSSNFYKIPSQYIYSHGMPIDASQYFYDNAHEFAKNSVLETLTSYYQKIQQSCNNSKSKTEDDLTFNLNQAIQIASIIKPLIYFFDKSQLNNFVISVLNSYKKWLDSLKLDFLKNYDESLLDKLNNILFAIANNGDIKTKITLVQISFYIKLINTDLLRLQFKALESIKSCLNKSYLHIKQMTSFLRNENFLCIVMNIKDMHHQLVPDFANIFGYMTKNGDAGIDEILQFWLLSVSQHPSVIDYFFKPWYSLLYDFPNSIINEFFLMVANVQKFPDASLKFLKKVAYKASEQPKTVLFTTLMELLNNNEFVNSEDLVVDLLCSLIPTKNDEFCLNLQQKCIKMISSNQQIDIALPLLKNSCKSVSVKKAREYFDAVLKSMLKGNVNVASYFDLLIKILENMKDKFTDDEFNDLKKLICPLLNSEHFRDVCEFFTNLLKIKNDLTTNEMQCEIFEMICTSKYFESGSFSFIKKLFEKISENTYNNKEGKIQPIDILWMLFLNNISCSSLCNYIIGLFESSPRIFIEKCFKYLSQYEEGSLILLDKYINYFEDGLILDNLGIQPNKFFDSENFYIVYLNGELEMEIKVYTWISYRSFIQRISRMLEKDPQRIRLKIGEAYLNSNNFYLQNFIHINVSCSSQGYISYVEAVKYKPPKIDLLNIPSTILLEKEYSTVLFKLLKKSKNQLVLSILNKIPTIPSENELIINENNESGINEDYWKKIFNIKRPNLFLYRLNIIGNLIKTSQMNWIEMLFLTDGVGVLFKIVLSKNLINHISEYDDFQLIFKIIILLMNIPDFEVLLDETISKLASESISQMIYFLNESNIKPKLILSILTIFKAFVYKNTEYIENNEDFNELLSKLLFSTNVSIRKEMLNIINLLSLESQKKIVSKLLPIAINEKCTEYFELLKNVSTITDDPTSLLNDLLSILYSRYKLPDKDKYGVIQVLKFNLPKQQFSNGLLLCMSILMSRMEQIPNAAELLHFLSTNIFFNSLKFFKPSNDILSILKTILKMAPETAKPILYKLKVLACYNSDYNERYNQMINEYNFTGVKSKLMIRPMKIELSGTARSRGLRNLGATCYMNATIQQLYNICELREKVLKIDFNPNHKTKNEKQKRKKRKGKNKNKSNEKENYHFDYKEERDWIQEFQYLFAQLSFYPSKAIDTLPFVSKWTGWDGERINPREQQDAVEFLQMILERLDERVKGLTSMFQGQIIHTLVGRKVQYSNTSVENFLTLSLEVKNHHDIQESLKTFLVPDCFEGSNGYNVEGQGMIDADRYHKIKIAPKILIIQLKRFEYNLSSSTRVKVNSEYHFPLELDLSPVMEINSEEFKEGEESSLNQKKSENKNMYELVGVVMHMGNAIAGHYFSHVKRENGEWITLNDQQVHKCDGENLPMTAAGGVMNCKANEYGFFPQENFENDTNAYLLFYRKINSNLDETEIESESQSRFSKGNSISDFSHFETEIEIDKENISNEQIINSNENIIKDDESSNKFEKDEDNKDNEIDHDCLCRLVSDIQQTISTEIVTSEVFSNLVLKLCSTNYGDFEDGEFLYNHMIQSLRLSSTKEKETSNNDNDNIEENGIYKLPFGLGSSVIELFDKKPKLVDLVLLQDSDIDEFLISNNSFHVRSFYSNLLCNALSSSDYEKNRDAINHFTEFMRSKLDSTIITNFSDFNEFFTVLTKLISVTLAKSAASLDKENWKKSILRFLNVTIPEYSKTHPNQKIYNNVDLSSVFQFASFFSIDFKIISDNILKWSFSMKHSFELIKYISDGIQKSEEATNIFNGVVQSRDLSAIQMSLLFVINLNVDDDFNKQRDEIIEKTILKQQSYKEFLDNTKLRVTDFNGKLAKRFLAFAQLFIKTYFFKSDSMIRNSFEQLIYTIFTIKSDNNTNNIKKDELYDFMMILIKDKKLLETSVVKSSIDTLTPATVYFQLLSWIVKNGNFKDEILDFSKDLFSLLKKFGKDKLGTSYQRCFNFIFEIFGDNPKEFIEHASSSSSNSSSFISKFISIPPEDFINKSENISKFLRFLYPLNCNQELFFSKNDTFKTMCLYGFNDWKSGQDLRIFISLKMNLNIEKKPKENKENNNNLQTQKDENLIMKICSVLWEKTVFEKNAGNGYLNFICLSWSILKEIPKTANVFFENKCYEFLWRKIAFELKQIKHELRLRAKMKLFAVFTESYMNENKDKKFIMKGSRNEALAKRYIKDLCISTTSAVNACFYTNFPSTQKIVVINNNLEKDSNETNIYINSKSQRDSASCPNLNENDSKKVDFRKSISHSTLNSNDHEQKAALDDSNPLNVFNYYLPFISSTNSGNGGIFHFLRTMISIDSYYFNEVSKMIGNERHSIVASCQIDSQISGAKFLAKLVNLMVKEKKIEESVKLLTKELLALSNLKEYFYETIELICEQLQSMISDLIKLSGKNTQNIRTGKNADSIEKMSYLYKTIAAFNNFYKTAKDYRMFSQNVLKVSLLIPDSNKDIKEEIIKCEREKWCESITKIVSFEIAKISKMKCEMKDDKSYKLTENQIKIMDSSRIAIKTGLDFVNEYSSRFNVVRPKLSVSKTQLKSTASKYQSIENSEFTDVADRLIQLETL